MGFLVPSRLRRLSPDWKTAATGAGDEESPQKKQITALRRHTPPLCRRKYTKTTYRSALTAALAIMFSCLCRARLLAQLLVLATYNGGMQDPDIEYLLALEAAAESPEDGEALFRLDMAKIW